MATVVFVVGAAPAAFADDIYNDVDATVDAAVEATTVAVGSSRLVTFAVSPQNGDGKGGCNLTGSTTTSFSVAASPTGVVSISPSSITFTACGETKSITVTGVSAGTARVTLTQGTNTTGGTYDTAPAAFDVTATSVCTATAPTAPALTLSAPAASGWYSASAGPASFLVSPSSNAEYSLDNGATWTAYTGSVTLTADGQHAVVARNFVPASGSCARVNGTASAPQTLKIDRTAPAFSLTVAPAANAAGWNNTAVSVTNVCSDAGSGLTTGTCPADTSSLGNGTNLLAQDFTISDVAGNTTTRSRRAIKVDTVAPVVSVTLPAANAAGWNDAAFTADWTCVESGSGLTAATPCPADEPFAEANTPAAERPDVTVTDVAGNVSVPVTRRAVSVDVTKPSASVLVTPNATEGWNNTTVTADYSCTDAKSGVAAGCPTDETLAAEGEYAALSFTAVDAAGNASDEATRREVKIDKTRPTVTVALRDADGNVIAANGAGWFNQAVTVDFTCTDPVSGGVASGVAAAFACPADHELGDGEHAAAAYEVRDVAGNVTTGTRPAIKIDTIAPTLSVVVNPADAGTDGWDDSTVTATWACADNAGGSGLPAGACPSPLTETYANGASAPAASHTVTDLAGNSTGPVTRRAVRVDSAAPAVTVATLATATLAPVTPNANGWFDQGVTLRFTCTDSGSGVVTSGDHVCPGDRVLTDGVHEPIAYDVADVAGNHRTGATPTVRIDTVAPTLAVAVTPVANEAGWNNVATRAAWTCVDDTAGSGIDTAFAACPTDATYGDGTTLAAATITVRDLAGNTASAARRAINVDTTAPAFTIDVTPDGNAAGWNNTAVSVDYTCSDGGSGLASGTCPADLPSLGNGTNEAAREFTVYDVAGNATTVGRRAIKVDTVAPVLSVNLPAPDSGEWNNTLVNAVWGCLESGSGLVGTCPGDELFDETNTPAAERTGVTVTDVAGNVSNAVTRRAVNVDVTKPSAGVLVSPDAVAGWNRTDVTLDYTCTDGKSGYASGCPGDATLTAEGAYEAVTFAATDHAGNTSDSVTRRAVQIDKTAPTVSVTLRDAAGDEIAPNANGWFNQSVRVDYECADPISGGVASGLSTVFACPADVTLGDGQHDAVAYDVRDVAGNATSGTRGAINVDTAAPTLSVSVSQAPNTAGWNNTVVTATWTCVDNDGGSGFAVGTCPAATETFGNGADAAARTVSVTDLAGNTAGPVTRRAVKVDTVKPVIVADQAVSTPAYNDGVNDWYLGSVEVRFSAGDGLSGLAPAVVTPFTRTSTGDGTAVTVGSASAGAVVDLAGNVADDVTSAAYRVDATAATTTVTGVTNGGSYLAGSVPAAGCSTSDTLSGVKTNATAAVTGGNGFGVGSFTATCAGAEDNVGNVGSPVSVTYSVGYSLPSYFQPINDPASTPSSFKLGSTVPVKFALLEGTARISDAAAQAIADACGATLAWRNTTSSAPAVDEPVNSNPANTGNCFRYDAANDQFVFNLGTKAMSAGTWVLTTTVSSGAATVATRSVSIGLRK